MFQSQIDHIEKLRSKYYQEVEELLKPEYEKLEMLKEQYNKHCDLIFDNKKMSERSYKVLINKTHDYNKIQCIYEGKIPQTFERYNQITIRDEYTSLSILMDETEYPINKNYWVIDWVSKQAKNESHNGDFEKIINYIL